MSKESRTVDLLIVGGGISGLWTLARARKAGFRCLLIEKEALGAGQTIASQGIIHGGLKYSLNSTLTRATQAISDMPYRWQQALNGLDSVALTHTNVLSQAHYFIPGQQLDSQFISFLGSKMAGAFTEKVATASLDKGYQSVATAPYLYRLNEFVIDIRSLLQDFYNQYHHYTLLHHFDINQLIKDEQNQHFEYHHPEVNIQAEHVLLCSGADYQASSLNPIKLQKRPLHMVMMKGKKLPAIYAHFITHGSKPELTITSHPHKEDIVWYLGGNLAETGVDLSSGQQIDKARQCLSRLVPHIDLSAVNFGSFTIDRAEAKQLKLLRPDDAFVSLKNGIMVGWPTKLAFAPLFADKVLSLMGNSPKHTQPFLTCQPLTLKKPVIADYPWIDL